MQVTMTLTKSTKGTHVYTDDSIDAIIPTLYIKKSGLSKVPPETIKVTIEEQ